jgi:branched-chain amino acid transport system permease protein
VFGFFIWWAEDNLDYQIQILNLMPSTSSWPRPEPIYGFTGLFSLGQAGFMAIGAYVCSILILAPEQRRCSSF